MDEKVVKDEFVIQKWNPDTEGEGGDWYDDDTEPCKTLKAAQDKIDWLVRYYTDCPRYQVAHRRVVEETYPGMRMAGCK